VRAQRSKQDMNIEPAGFPVAAPRIQRPRRGMVLAAGLGKRMRPLTVSMPKPLVPVRKRPLIDYALDQLERAGVEEVVVNVHYFAEMVRGHVSRRRGMPISISDESDRLLDTGGGIANAIGRFDDQAFFLLNSDTFWIDGVTPNLELMASAWRDEDMDGLLLLSPTVNAVGYGGPGDFLLAPDGRIARRPERRVAPFVYAGAAILHPRLFAGRNADPFSLNEVFDTAIEAGRLRGVRLEGMWFHVGTPGAIRLAERAIADSAA